MKMFHEDDYLVDRFLYVLALVTLPIALFVIVYALIRAIAGG